jgi:hypothetical protein
MMSDSYRTKYLRLHERSALNNTRRIDLTAAATNVAQQFHERSAAVIAGLLSILRLHSRPAF